MLDKILIFVAVKFYDSLNLCFNFKLILGNHKIN